MNAHGSGPAPPRRAHRPPHSPAAPLEKGAAERIGTFVLAVATIGGVAICALLAAPFLGAFTWALTLAITVAPLHAKIESRLKRPNGTAIISVLIVALLMSIPAVLIVQRLIGEAAAGATLVQGRIQSGAIENIVASHPFIAPIGDWIQQHFDLSAILAGIATWMSNAGAALARGSVFQMISVLLTFYLLYYFLRDRQLAGRMLQDWLPLTAAESEELFARVIDTVHATIYGTVAMAVAQGVLGGLMFWLLGLSTPLFWGLLMGLLTIVPVVGSFIVWLPAALVLALDGSWAKAFILTLFGVVVVIGGIHNVLYPMLVGKRLRLHTVVSFLSMIGGLIVFGAGGFILGPLVATITSELLTIWRRRVYATAD